MVESIKHTTADEAELSRLRERAEHPDLLVQCRKWLDQQLAHIEPRGVIFTGNRGIALARDLGVLGRDEKPAIGDFHGEARSWRSAQGAEPVPVIFSYAFSAQTKAIWNGHAGSGRVRTWFARMVGR
jgi:uracil-DNA glycosylase